MMGENMRLRGTTGWRGGVGPSRHAVMLLFAVFLAMALAMSGCSSSGGESSDGESQTSSEASTETTTTTQESASEVPEGAINWSEGISHIGETVTVYGTVLDSSYEDTDKGQPSYIDIGAAYPDPTRVSMVVYGEDRGNFEGDPESMYLGKTVCVTGELYEHEGTAYVKVTSPDQVEVLD